MSELSNTWTPRMNIWTPRILSVLRVVAGLLFLQYGTAKIFGYPEVAAFKNVQLASLTGVAGMMELVGGALLIAGLFTRPVAFVLSGEMAFAYFLSHAPRNFIPLVNNGTLAIVFCFVFFYLAFAGPGPWSADAAVRNKT